MPIDPVKEAEELQQLFFKLAKAVDNLRVEHYTELSHAQQVQLRDQADALLLRGQQYGADALAAIQQQIEPHLANIKKATKDAADALAHLENINKALSIADAAVALVGSITSGDVAAIGGQVNGLLQAIA